VTTDRALQSILLATLLATSVALAAEPTGDPPAPLCPESRALADGVSFLSGRFVAGAQPDGNTVLLGAPEGLVVIDTGRHAEHTRAILDCAAGAGLPVAAVINTHWHLDHIGGNPRVRAAFPEVEVWASDALAGARTGFLADYRAQLVDAIAASQDLSQRAAWEDELRTIDSGPALAPDHVVAASGTREVAGRELLLGLVEHAVTAGDLWVLDPATGVLAAGDLVTLPAPLFDTACPGGWRAALDSLAALEFRLLVPGHGPPLTREQFERYRSGFTALLACAASESSDGDCVEGWLQSLGPLVPEPERELARALLGYYLTNLLRAGPGDAARWCDEG
jgi:glyoxylase-like metal-dependent hydrolase (beta-lactamase superfamily II)